MALRKKQTKLKTLIEDREAVTVVLPESETVSCYEQPILSRGLLRMKEDRMKAAPLRCASAKVMRTPKLRDINFKSFAYYNMAEMYKHNGRVEDAIYWLERSLELFRVLKDSSSLACVTSELGYLFAEKLLLMTDGFGPIMDEEVRQPLHASMKPSQDNIQVTTPRAEAGLLTDIGGGKDVTDSLRNEDKRCQEIAIAYYREMLTFAGAKTVPKFAAETNLGLLYIRVHRLREAETYLLSAQETAKTHPLTAVRRLASINCAYLSRQEQLSFSNKHRPAFLQQRNKLPTELRQKRENSSGRLPDSRLSELSEKVAQNFLGTSIQSMGSSMGSLGSLSRIPS
jgi:tetratricopeptide (TPR) repeat protein